MNSSESSNPADSSGDFRLDYYPDLVAQGGLQAAIRRVARERRIDLGATPELPEGGAQEQDSAEFVSPRGLMRVNLGLGERRFSIALDSDQGNFVWASGSTADLSEVARLMSSWRQGIKLAELTEQFPFMEFDRLSQGYEDGNPVEVQWDVIIADDNFLEYRDLIQALHSDLRLREMFPFFSHWTLRMAKDFRSAQAGEILIRPNPDGGYTIWSSSVPEEKREFHGLDDLIRAALSILEDL